MSMISRKLRVLHHSEHRVLNRYLALTGGRRQASVAVSALVKGLQEPQKAATSIADSILEALSGGPEPTCTIWFAKGYGAQRVGAIASTLKDRLGQGVVVGSSAEGGLIGESTEVQNEAFAVAALALRIPGLKAYPFHTHDLSQLPKLQRGGSWPGVASSSAAPCVLALCSLPLPNGQDPQTWAGQLDQALAGSSTAPVVVGGLTVGNYINVDGEVYGGGGFGIALEAKDPCISLDTVVCQGAVPFGPWLEITGVVGDHIITGLDGKSPRELLEPILNGPEVPGAGHSMAGVFVDPVGAGNDSATLALAAAAMGGRPNCLVRPMHSFTPDGHLLLSPLTDTMRYSQGMKLQMHCFSPTHAVKDLQTRAQHDMSLHEDRPPDAALVISCGARGVSFFGEEGVESKVLQEVWGRKVPSIGFFAGGELGPVGLKTYMHSYTTSCLLLRYKS